MRKEKEKLVKELEAEMARSAERAKERVLAIKYHKVKFFGAPDRRCPWVWTARHVWGIFVLNCLL